MTCLRRVKGGVEGWGYFKARSKESKICGVPTKLKLMKNYYLWRCVATIGPNQGLKTEAFWDFGARVIRV